MKLGRIFGFARFYAAWCLNKETPDGFLQIWVYRCGWDSQENRSLIAGIAMVAAFAMVRG